MGLQTMGWKFLSERLAQERRVQLLHPPFFDGRNQRHVLSIAVVENGAGLARARAGRLSLRRQRQSLPDAHQAAEGNGARAAQIFQPARPAWRSHRADPLAAAAELSKDGRERDTAHALP